MRKPTTGEVCPATKPFGEGASSTVVRNLPAAAETAKVKSEGTNLPRTSPMATVKEYTPGLMTTLCRYEMTNTRSHSRGSNLKSRKVERTAKAGCSDIVWFLMSK